MSKREIQTPRRTDIFQTCGNNPQGVAALLDQATRQGARLVAKLIDDSLDPLARFISNIGSIIDHPGYSLGGYSGGFGNLLDSRSYVMGVHIRIHLRQGDTVIVIGNDNMIANIEMFVK